ncbi:hypothetical protein NDU88_009167 [Pleurodeles waltl]|uniref:Uncharacterized protein n=1 Tax=Pleurodeles waltl TaxID=8319 RepID=A0AAV7RZN3_PLEWA|nr:hypothetical protein NDU88_009167 [Pleurodeles waltl]
MYNARGVKKRCRSYSAAKRIVEYAVSRVYISKKELAIYYYRDRLFANPRMSRKEKTVKRLLRSMLTHTAAPENVQAEGLDCPICMEKVISATALQKPLRSPGLDGFLVLFYNTFFNMLAPILTLLYN